MMRRTAILLLAISGTALVAGPVAAQPLAGPPSTVRELAWGEVLFRLYQEDQMGALVRLAVAQSRGELGYHASEGRLVQGGLYLAWGLREEAAEIFRALLAEGAPPSQRDRAWYWLARIHYERGEHAQAAAALARTGRQLSPEMMADRIDLEGRVLIALGRYVEAASLLADTRQPGAWRAFADFNRAVALVRAGRNAEGLPELERLGNMRADGPELAMLRDRANLALGVAQLDAGDGAAARAALDRVRLDSPYAARALLAAGWAEAAQGRFRESLGPWTRLAEFPDPDGASLEALLAVPWAWHQLQESGESLVGYQRAAAACERELVQLARAGDAVVDGGELLGIVLASTGAPPTHGPLAPYVHALAADHPFRAVAADLRDLHALRENLFEWQRSLGAFHDMVAARRSRFASVAPRVGERLGRDELAAMDRRHAELEERVRAARAAGDPAALATSAERQLLGRIAAARARIATLPEGEERAGLEERIRRINGALAWQLNHDWPARIHDAERALRTAGRELEAAHAARAGLATQLAAAPDHFEGFDARIEAAAERVEALLARVEADHARRFEELRALIRAVLQERETRVAAYLGQARFALAAAYDQALQPQAARDDSGALDAGGAP
jgi:hypothetical protein